ncbi:hypothetical protein K3495_g832 [Podosphaera aphanis]|nr:hypothetical protein K3495_g832 [Podosphaera aphanis]
MIQLLKGELPHKTHRNGDTVPRTEVQPEFHGIGSSSRGGDEASTFEKTKTNRYSTLTEATEAPTLSTLSPLESPIQTDYLQGGLAPRPSSFINHSKKYDLEFLEKRTERRSRTRDHVPEENPGSLPSIPQPSEVSRKPSSSYKPLESTNKPLKYKSPTGPNTKREPDNAMNQKEVPNFLSDELKNTQKEDIIPPPISLKNDATKESRPKLAYRQQSLRVHIPPTKDLSIENEGLHYRSPLQKLEMKLGSFTKEEEHGVHAEAGVNKNKETNAQQKPRIERPETAHLLSPSRSTRLNDSDSPRTPANNLVNRGIQLDPNRDYTNNVPPIANQVTQSTINGNVIRNGSSEPGAQTSAQFARRTTSRLEMSSTFGPRRDTAFRSHPQINKDKKLPELPSELSLNSPTHGRSVETSPMENGYKPERRLSKFSRIAREKFLPRAKGSSKRSKDAQIDDIKTDGFDHSPSSDINITSPQSKSSAGTEDNHFFPRFLQKHKSLESQDAYTPVRRLNERRKSGVAQLSGTYLDIGMNGYKMHTENERLLSDPGSISRLRSINAQRKAEAFDGEYDESAAPTRFKPHLFLQSGPILRYCGLRREVPRNHTETSQHEREIWRGSIMIVCKDLHSSYELAPTLRLFLQPMELLPPPPSHVDESGLASEYIDPLAGSPRIGRDGRTLYVRPVEALDIERDLSREESADGLFEMDRPQFDEPEDTKGTYQRPNFDGEKAGKYKEVRGFRLHSEQGMTFWRFNIEIELREKQQRIAYRINRGPATGFWVPARGQAMNIMFYSANGFSNNVDPNQFCGPDPMWRDVLNTHQTEPFHVMLGGGNQIYNDNVLKESPLFRFWAEIQDISEKKSRPFTAELEHELNTFYLDHYCSWFSQGLFGLAVSQIPMVNVLDSHEILDGYGSYQEHYMCSPVLEGLGAIAFKYYMLFQHQSCIDEVEETEPSWILGARPGPYIKELSRSIFTRLGRPVGLLGLDCRTERTSDRIISAETYHKIFSRLEHEVVYGDTKHLIVVLGIPRAHIRLGFLENGSQPKVIQQNKASGRKGSLVAQSLGDADNSLEFLDNIEDYKTARNHQDERRWLIQELQDLAAAKSVRVTILGGGIHIGAVGLFYSNPKLSIPKDRDFRYMTNIIPSTMANAPPPEILASFLKKKKKIRHLDSVTDESLMPIFTYDENGKPRSNKRLITRRNWCSIRLHDSSSNQLLTPLNDELFVAPPHRSGSLLRRLSSSRGRRYSSTMISPDSGNILMRGRPDNSRPPLSNQQFFNDGDGDRSGNGKQIPGTLPASRRGSVSSENPNLLQRTRSLTLKDFKPGNIFRRKSSRNSSRKRSVTDDNKSYDDNVIDDFLHQKLTASYESENNDVGFSPTAQRYHSTKIASTSTTSVMPGKIVPEPGDFENQTRLGSLESPNKKGPLSNDISLDGGLDICIHVEVNSKDPAGITTPYQLIVPALFYEKTYRTLV